MGMKRYGIGELARLTGLSVRRIRFYSDKGLLPPTTRTVSNYRVYTDLDLARLDLIRALRGAGVGLKDIGKLLARQMSLAEVLRTRLEILDAEIVARRRVAAVLRATLRSHDPTDADLRRLWMMTALSNARMAALVEQFVERISEGAAIDDGWRDRLVDVGTPELPDDPTPEQIEAWSELATMLADPAFIAELRAEMADMWSGDFDPAAYRAAAEQIHGAIRAAMVAGIDPGSGRAREIGRDWLRRSAAAMARVPDGAFLDWHLRQYDNHHGRTARYRQLMATLQGQAADAPAANEWTWMHQVLLALRSDHG